MASKTVCVIKIDGQDVSSDVMPYLMNLSITDKAGFSSDECSIELDDRGGVLAFPRDGAAIEVYMGDRNGVRLAFRGTVDEVKTKGDRDGGTVLTVSSKGFDTKGKAKEQRQKHWDDKTLSDVMSEAGRAAGLDSVQVSPALAGITRKYWAMQNESFIHFGERLAREVGGTFKISGGKAIIAERNGGKSASGADLPTISATRGVNLLGWDINPVLGRPRYAETKSRYYDAKAAKWVYRTEQIEDPDAKATFVDRYSAADELEASIRALSFKKESERSKGAGTISIDGNVDAQPEANVILANARPGADGTYRIDGVQHEFNRSSGWTTRLDVKQPQGEAGKDSRTSKRKVSTARPSGIQDSTNRTGEATLAVG